MRGTVVKWDLEKYYGFIKTEDNKKYYFHGTGVLLPPGKTVAYGDQVEFDVAPDRRHPPNLHAVNITVIRRADAVPIEGAPSAAPSSRYLRSDMGPMPVLSTTERRMAAERIFRRR